MTNMCHHAKFHQNQSNGFWDMAIFRISRWPPSAILDFEILKFLVNHQIARSKMHHCTKFHQNRSNGCTDITFDVFQNGNRPPSWIFTNLIFWTAGELWMINVCYGTKFQHNRPNGFVDIAFFSILTSLAVIPSVTRGAFPWLKR